MPLPATRTLPKDVFLTAIVAGADELVVLAAEPEECP
jgi:hypothetical protein